MTTIDKAAIGWSMGIVAVAIAIAFGGQNIQEITPDVNIPESPAPVDKATEPTMEKESGAQKADPFADIAEKVKSGQTTKPLKAGWEKMESMQDPGIGHEQHQLAVLLTPSDKVYSGTLQYDASEPIQLVTLHGPLGPGDDSGQAIWSPDGKTKFALTFVDPNNARGEWKFAGNALAVHTMNPTQFTVDYKIDYTEVAKSKTVKTDTTESVQDPGVGHESHQLAIMLEPSSDAYSGIMSYSASEPIQLVSLRGPISSSEKPAMTWTPDGETIFALTFVDPKKSMGSWEFSGNALAVHTMNPTQFTVSYSVSATATAGKTIEMKEEMKVSESSSMPKEEMKSSGPKTIRVSIPAETAVPGCEETNECYTPSSVTVNAGDTVEWTNDDTAAHTVTAGTPADGPSGIFDSDLVMGGATFEYTFSDSGKYEYFCMVHPWMVGNVQVN